MRGEEIAVHQWWCGWLLWGKARARGCFFAEGYDVKLVKRSVLSARKDHASGHVSSTTPTLSNSAEISKDQCAEIHRKKSRTSVEKSTMNVNGGAASEKKGNRTVVHQSHV